MNIDISGNWIWSDAPTKGLIVSQPVPPKKGNLFYQSLVLPRGEYRLNITYRHDHDHLPYMACFFNELCYPIEINGQRHNLTFEKKGSEAVSVASTAFRHEGGPLMLSAYVRDTRFFNSTVIEAPDLEEHSEYYALPILNKEQGELTVVRGVPFYSVHHGERRVLWGYGRWLRKPKPRWQMSDWEEAILVGDVEVDSVYFLGMTHCYDISNGSWYTPTGDYSFHHFIGDNLGSIRLVFTDGETTTVPLILGYNVWYGTPWDVVWDQQFKETAADMREEDDRLFGGIEADRETVQRSIRLDDGIRRMGEETNERYLFTLQLGGKKLHSVQILPSEEKHGIVTVSAITVKTNESCVLRSLPSIASSEGRLTENRLDDVSSEQNRQAIEDLKHVFYSYVDELPHLTEAKIPNGYFGPRYEFGDTQDAYLAATFLYYNAPECAAHIATSGTGCASSTARYRTTQYMSGIGLIVPFEKPIYQGIEDFLQKYQTHEAMDLPGCGEAWGRGVGELLRESMAFGYDKCTEAYIDWMDDALFRYANPPHWNRIVGTFESEGYTTRQVGNTEERGNRENDGHGICMWGRAMVWHWLGRDRQWNEKHWNATKAACDWIKWQLDTDEYFPGTRKDILFTESECAHGAYDTYSTGNCLHGLRLSIAMAKQLHMDKEAAEWHAIVERLASGMLEHLTEPSKYGDIWHTEGNCDWQDHMHKLVHLQLSTDGITYTPLDDYQDGFDRKFLEIDQNTYRYLMRNKHYDFLRMYGYGQGFAAQSALLLDRMEDAEKLLHLMFTHCYFPKMEGFIVPEGVVTHPNGKYYVPVCGYTGQDSHVADSVKAARLMLGVDDNRVNELHLVPRFPLGWTKIRISDYPVILEGQRGTVEYTVLRDNGYKMEIRLSRETDLHVRIGPFAEAAPKRVIVNGVPTEVEGYCSGDSHWGWIRPIHGDHIVIEAI